MSAPATALQQQFMDDLVRHKLLIPSGEPGIVGRGETFEDVRNRLDLFITEVGMPDKPERPRFPPVIPKRTLEKAGYLKSFPHLCGSVFGFAGPETALLDLTERAERGENWGVLLSMTSVVLVPAACYPAYPAIALRGALPVEGLTLDLGASYVFRNEPSGDPARLQMFHQREMVRFGDPRQVSDWRETWMRRAALLFEELGLDAARDVASDPFFGRAGKLLAKSQREERLKFEFAVPIASPQPTAVASFNFHHDYFASAFGIHLHDGRVANTACLGFGLERITLALFRTHGLEIRDWPAQVRSRLWSQAREATAVA